MEEDSMEMATSPTRRRKKYSFAREEPPRRKTTQCIVRTILCLHKPLVKFQQGLEKFGFLVARNPKPIIFLTVAVMVIGCLGFLRMHVSDMSSKSFYPTDSLSNQHLKYLREFEPDSRREEIMFIPETQSNILTQECLLEALTVYNTVTNITGYQVVCARRRSNSPCMMINFFELFNFDSKMISNFSAVLNRALNGQKAKLLSNGGTLSYAKNKMFSQLKTSQKQNDGNNYRFSAKAMKIVYFLKEPQNDTFKTLVTRWEKEFISEMNSLKDKLKCSRVLYLSEGDKEEAISELFAPHIISLLISISVILFFVFILTFFLATKGALYLFGIGILFIGLMIVSSVSISFAANVSFSNAAIIMLIFLGGKGLMDILMVAFELENLMTIPSVKHRVAGCATKIGLIATTTAFFDFVVFGFTQLTLFPGIRDVYLVALFAIPLRYFFFFPYLLGCSSLWLQKHPFSLNQNNSFSHLFLSKMVANHDNADALETYGTFIFFGKYGKWLTRRLPKILVVLLTVAIIVGCVYVQRRNSLNYQDNAALLQSTRIASFESNERKYFQDIDVNLFFLGPQIDYKMPSVQNSINSITKELSHKKYNIGNMPYWLTELLSWSKQNGIDCQRHNFRLCLQEFLAVPQNAVYRQDIVFASENSKRIITFSRLHFTMNLNGSLADGIEQLNLLRKDVQTLNIKTGFVIVPAAPRFLLLDMVATFKSKSIDILIVVGLAIFLCPQPLTASIRIGILLVMSFILHVEELIVLLQIWDIPFNPASFYCLFIGLLWALHLNIQVLQVRGVAAETTLEMRTVATLRSAGPSILMGVIISIACSISLSFIFPFLSTIFLCILPVLFSLALFQSLALLPVIILLSSKPAEKFMKYLAIEDSYDIKTLSGHQELEAETEHKESYKEQNQRQPTISIIGISCRFPQAGSKEKFFEMLSNGKCAVTQFPSNRPEEYEIFQELYHPKRFVKSRICTVGGAFLENIRGFDAEFFKISSQEAPAMDPQQRILLQVVYEAIEDAGLRLEDLQRCKTGVFVGVMNLDYGVRVMQPDNRVNMDQFYSTGTTSSIVANRISFSLNLTGPSLSVDTACSSSLTALNIAQCCLKNGQCDVAIVCAPNIILDAAVQMTFSIGGLLAPDGRCKCFDAAADGYGRGEGFAAVILKPTLISLADNDDIYCEILACEMNNDGQNAYPITAPSPKTQTELSKAVLEASGVHASSIEYVEAHGTGTAIGDAVETTSIANAYCDRSAVKQRILRIGSVKSNLNHTESASGLAGLIKVALMIKKKTFLPTVSIRSLNPKLKLSEKGMVVQDSCEQWDKDDESCRIAAINSFGYGGSNVHAILKEVQAQLSGSNCEYEIEKNKFILTISAKSNEALRRLATKFESWMRGQPDNQEFKLNLCYSLTERRSHHENRLGLVFHSVKEAADSLDTFASNGNDIRVVSGVAGSAKQSLIFVFGGQGANWEGMGNDMMDCEPLFRDHIYEIDRMLKDLREDWSLIEEITSPKKTRVMGNIIGQPACFAIQYATYKLLESWGIIPSAVLGHSLGELAAACCCGALSLKEALQIVLSRSKCHEKCSTEGSMAALEMQEEVARNLIIDLKLENLVCISAVNDQSNVTISGNKVSIECIETHLKSQHPGVFWKILPTARAFHSTYIDAVKVPFCTEMESIKCKANFMRIPMYSTVLGDKVFSIQLEQDYWWKNMRECVLFRQAVTKALQDGHTTIIEISPRPILQHYLHNIVASTNTHSNKSASILMTFPPRREPEEHRGFLKNTVCRLYTMGYPIYWSAMYGYGQRRLVRFPTYPWKEKEFWYRDKPPQKPIRALKQSESTLNKSHPFLREVKQTEQFSGILCWETEIDLHRFPTFKDHVLTQGGPVLPGSACVEMAIAMAAERFQRSWGIEVQNVRFTNLLTLPESQVRLLRLRLEMNLNNTEGDFFVCNVQDDGTEMVLAKGSVFVESSSSIPVHLHSSQTEENQTKTPLKGNVVNEDLKEVISNMAEVPLSTFRHLTEKLGFNFGPCYCLVKRIWRKEDKAVCVLEMDGPFASEIPLYVIHPAFLDACFQTAVACEDDDESEDTRPTTVPIGVKCFAVVDSDIPRTTYCHVTKTASGDSLTYDMRLVDAFGKVYITIEQFQSTEIANLIHSPKLDEVAYKTKWVESRTEGKNADISDSVFVVLLDSREVAISFVDALSKLSNPKVLTVKLPKDTACDDLVIQLKTVLSQAGSYSKLTIINFWPVETSFIPSCTENINLCQELSFMSSLDALKFLADVQSSSSVTCKLVVVSQCTQFVSGEKDAMIPWASSVWGFCRTARLEFQSIRTINVDLGAADNCEIQQLAKEITEQNVDDEVVLRHQTRYVNRLVGVAPGSQPITNEGSRHSELLSSPVYLVTHPNTGQLCLRRLTESLCTQMQENIEVGVTNFWIPQDIQMRLHSTNQFIGYSGSILKSSKTTNESLQPGQLICGITRSNRLGNILQAKDNDVIKKPEELSLPQAASLSSCLPLAYFALKQAVNVSGEGSKGALVIIHEANRDLGLAGMLVAKALGFSVICTSSDPYLEASKRLLKKQGAWLVTDAYVSDLTSHDLSQEAEAVVFFYEPLPNSMRKSSQLLKTGGKIIIVGELRNNHVVMPFDKSISCQRIDYNDILDPPGRYRDLWSSCWQLMTSTETLKKIFQIHQQETSIFDTFTGSQPSLKENVNVVRTPGLSFSSFSFKAGKTTSSTVQLLPVGMDQYKLKHNRTYMVVGGVRGFGFEVARWMAYNGAGTIVLVARSTPSRSKLLEVSSLEKKTGAKIKIFQADVSDPVQMREMSSNKLLKLPSMAGIVLTAMVLRDQLIPHVDRESFLHVMAPKVKGAYILHQLSLNMDLDFFVTFSSIASLLGNPGQAAYSAANAFLDSLACYRRRVLDLPALSINWGPIKGAGVLQRQENVATLLSRAGYRMLDAKQAIEFMGQFLIKEPLTPEVGLFDADWSRLFESSTGISSSLRFEAIKAQIESLQTEKDLSSLGPKILMESDDTKKQVMVEEFVNELIASWCGVSVPEIDLKTSLYSLGLDSFFALTFKMQLEATLEVSFEVFYFMQPDTTPTKIVEDILNKLKSKQQTNQANTNSQVKGKTSGNIQESPSTTEVPESRVREYPKDLSCPTATYQLTPLYTPEGADVMFFCIHPAGRYVMNLVPISIAFKSQSLISFYAIGYTDPTMTGDSRSVRQLARSYVDMIKQLQRHGPYFLGGQSFGGLIAFEMASLLTEEGEDVAFVAMIDTFPWEISNRSAAARLETLFGGTKLEHLMERLFQATFEQILSKLAATTLKMTPEEYDSKRATATQDGIIEFLQNRALELDIPLYDIRRLRESLHQDNELASRKHREWKPGAVYYQGPVTFLKSADQRFTPIKPLQESSDEAWSLLVDGNIDVYMCPGDHLALSEPKDAFVIGGILATAIGVTYRQRFGLPKNVQRMYMEKKALQKFALGVDMFLHSRKGSKAPKYGKLYLEELHSRLLFKEATTKEDTEKKKHGSRKRRDKVIDLTGLSNVLSGRHVAKTLKIITSHQTVKGYQTGNLSHIVAIVMCNHRVYNFELLNLSDLKAMYQMLETVLSISMTQYAYGH